MPQAPPRTATDRTSAATIFNLLKNMVCNTPFVRTTAWADASPPAAALPAAKHKPAFAVTPSNPAGAADAAGTRAAVSKPADRARPRRASRPRPVQSALDRSDRPLQLVGGLLVGLALQVAEHDGTAV